MPTVPLGLMMVAEACRRSGHDVDALDLMFEADPCAVLLKRIHDFGPEAIGISVRNIDDQSMENPKFLLENVRPLVRWCREAASAPVVLGGAGYSIFPEETLEYLGADMGVQGEGEEAFPLLLDSLAGSRDPATVCGVRVRGRKASAKRQFCDALDRFDLPREDAWQDVDPGNTDIWVPIESRRGCPNRCSYCSTPRIQGSEVRTRSPFEVAIQMRQLADRGFRQFYIVDNSFNIPQSHGLELCRALSDLQLDIQWKAILYPHGITEDLVRAMKRTGCCEVALGFESGSVSILKEMNKHFLPEEVRQAGRMLRDNGLRSTGFLLLGGPGETRATVEESLEFADSLDLDALRTTVGIRIYPGTKLAARAVAEGIVQSEGELLMPRFYLAREVDPWIRRAVAPGFRTKD